MQLNKNGRNETYDKMNEISKSAFYYKEGDDWKRAMLSISYSGGIVYVHLNVFGRSALLGSIFAAKNLSEGSIINIGIWRSGLLQRIADSVGLPVSDVKEGATLYDLI